MDTPKIQTLRELADKQIKDADRYAETRRIAGKAESDLNILLTAYLPDLRQNKKNLGVEMARFMLMETNDVAKKLYAEWLENEAIFKGLEKLLEAQAAKLIFEQSIMKHRTDGERFG